MAHINIQCQPYPQVSGCSQSQQPIDTKAIQDETTANILDETGANIDQE